MTRNLLPFLGLGILLALALIPLVSFAKVAPGHTQLGVASYYADRFHGRKTASGERYDRTAYTAAHRHLPLGTRVRVTDLKSGNSVKVTVNDRGPYVKGRIIDLSRKAAGALGMTKRGLAKVRIEVLSVPRRGWKDPLSGGLEQDTR